MVLLGVLAIRLKGVHKILEWNGDQMQFANIGENETMKVVKTFGFEMVDSKPTWNVKHVELDALESATEYIKHTYHNGWSLPDMPA